MRLLNTSSIELHEFFGSKIPKYAILSHIWEDGEISFKDVTKHRNPDAPEWAKVRKICEVAKSRCHECMWVDTCCIDKRSSSELSEAINSMWNWYWRWEECYAFLSDVTTEEGDQAALSLQFRSSRWFTRGWTQQELLAPPYVIFFSQNWTPFGTKESLRWDISTATGIIDDVQNWTNSRRCSIATRMSWASRRSCTREEDIAYCLLGIFGINMPLLYGEGGRNAFRRLQLELIKTSDDESIFAWLPHAHGIAYDEPPGSKTRRDHGDLKY